jgi:hypothetical protein
MRLPILLLLAGCAALPAAAQNLPPAAHGAEEKEPFVKAVADAAVADLATKLEESFVFPDKGQAYATMLRANLAAGKYASFADKAAFARAVTDDLQAVHKDGHLRVQVVPAEARGGPSAAPPPDARVPRGPMVANAISRSGWVADGVAYVRFEGFPGNDETVAALRAFLDKHQGAKTLIVDARSHRGGGLSEMDLLFAQLYDKPVVLVDMDTRIAVEQRRGSPIAGHPTLRQIDGPEGVVRREHFVVPAPKPTLADTNVYLLTSKKTASAGEHFSLALKRTDRATLIGEATAGAGHYGGTEPLDKDFTYAAFIPVGRTFDPDTGEGWEGVGVQPDVAVPADQALDEALKRAGLSLSAEEALAGLK